MFKLPKFLRVRENDDLLDFIFIHYELVADAHPNSPFVLGKSEIKNLRTFAWLSGVDFVIPKWFKSQFVKDSDLHVFSNNVSF